MNYSKLEFLKEQRRDVFRELGEVISLSDYKRIRPKLQTLDELINETRSPKRVE